MSRTRQARKLYTIEEGRLTQPVIDTWQNLQRLGLTRGEIHSALQPMIALVDHLNVRQTPPIPVRKSA